MTLDNENIILEDKKADDSSKYLELIIKNAPLIYFILDNTGTFLLSRGKGLQDMGLEQDQIVGLNAFEIYKQFEEMVIAIKKALNGQQSYHSSYVKETDRYYKTHILPIRQNNGANYVLGISIDETSTMRIQNELIQKEREITELKKLEMISKMGSGLSHEFNNILQSLVGITNLIDMQLPAELPEIKELVVMLQKVLNKGKDITFQLQNISNAQMPERELIDINQEIRDYGSDALTILKNKNISLRLQLTSKKIVIEGNRSQFKLILSNLITNSFHAIEQNGYIEISTKIIDNKAQILFSDNGSGIQDISKIFELFYTTKNNGLGIGLPTIKSIVTQYNGTITAEKQSKGSLFTITFPLRRKRIIQSKNFQFDLSNLENNLVGKTIIVVDDDSIILQTIEMFFNNINCTIKTFSTALEAKKFSFDLKRKGNVPDIIITDILMPNYSGLDLLKNIREDDFFKNTKFLLISGFSSEFYDESQNILSENVKFLAKPFTKDQIMTKLLEFFN